MENIRNPEFLNHQRQTLRRILFWLIILTGICVIWYSLLHANVFWVEETGYVPVSINAIGTADYSLDSPSSVNQVNLSIISDVIGDLDPNVDAYGSFATLIASLNTPVPAVTPIAGSTNTSTPTVTPLTSPTNSPTPSVTPIASSVVAGNPTLGVPTIMLTLPAILPTINVPIIIPSLSVPVIPPLPSLAPIVIPPIVPTIPPIIPPLLP